MLRELAKEAPSWVHLRMGEIIPQIVVAVHDHREPVNQVPGGGGGGVIVRRAAVKPVRSHERFESSRIFPDGHMVNFFVPILPPVFG